jgi:hypothetical protein
MSAMKYNQALRCISACIFFFPSIAPANTWIDPKLAAAEDPAFLIQGEYKNETMGAQVVALGGGNFDVYLLEGGLPGAGWEPGRSRIKLSAALKDGKVEGRDGASKSSVTISGGKLSLSSADGKTSELSRIERQSQTLGAKAPQGAVVLFDGSNADQWNNGKFVDGLLQASGITSKQSFGDYHLHLEFRTPYMPNARGQQRGNSGVYHSGRWETQVLDSFGLEGMDNEAGGLYSIAKPRLNMCLPPLAWQTYDVDFTAAKFDTAGRFISAPRITVKLNGVIVHQDAELSKDGSGKSVFDGKVRNTPEGPIHLQNHNDPVVYRNIWLIPAAK